ncbi:MAG: discoidin domain-containing protein [bacterium]|nr:discoidin domain-containing protein [bacterium]
MEKYAIKNNNSGFALVFVFFFMILVAGIVLGYLYFSSQSSASLNIKKMETLSFYAAEAAQARAIQYLQNDWTGVWNILQPNTGALGNYGPITENLATNTTVSYDFIIDNWNLADITKTAPFGLATITANVASQGGNIPAAAVDGAMNTNWRTINNPGPLVQLTIQFPANSNYMINEIRIRRQGNPPAGRPTSYTWATSTDGITYTVRFTRNVDPGLNQWYDIFPAPASNVNYIRWNITNWNGNRIDINEIEIPWIRIKTRCRINSTTGTSYIEKYIRSVVLTNNRGAGATIYRVTPSSLPGTNLTAIWDEIPRDTYNTAIIF